LPSRHRLHAALDHFDLGARALDDPLLLSTTRSVGRAVEGTQ